jgi:hypothetical protein
LIKLAECSRNMYTLNAIFCTNITNSGKKSFREICTLIDENDFNGAGSDGNNSDDNDDEID